MGSVTEGAAPRVTQVLVLAGHPAPGDNIHQPTEGDCGEWQGELGFRAGGSHSWAGKARAPKEAVTPIPSSSHSTPAWA